MCGPGPYMIDQIHHWDSDDGCITHENRFPIFVQPSKYFIDCIVMDLTHPSHSKHFISDLNI